MAGLKIGTHEVPIPVIQGGMGIGISLSGLAGSVAACGGVGVLSAAQIGFREPDFDKSPLEANLRALARELKRARQQAPQGVIGVNIMVASTHYETYVKAAVRAGADLIISGAGLPMTLPAAAAEAVQEMKAEASGKEAVKAGTKTPASTAFPALAPIVSSVKSADLICRYWLKKYNRLPDLVIIEGPLAGGHLGFRREELEMLTEPDYDAEIRRIIARIRSLGAAYGKEIPVAVAGGIYDGSDLLHALSLGADGVQAATRFVTTYECDAATAYKQAYLDAKKEDIVIVKSPVGMPGRAICNAFIQKTQKGQLPHGRCHGCIRTCSPKETPYCITEALMAAANGELENALIFAGANAWRAEKMEHVKDIMEEFKEAAEKWEGEVQ